jgi:hypothetical protein
MRTGRSRLAVICALGLAGFCLTAARAADQTPADKKAANNRAADKKPAEKAAAPVNPWHELTVSPRAIETPLMKYRLLPAEYELREGNAAPILLRLPWEQNPYFREVVPTFTEYLDLPLNSPKLRGQQIFAFFEPLQRAAYRKTADWQYPIGEQPLGNILIPDIQGGKSIAGYGLAVWIRQRLAEGNLARARQGILVGLAVSRHYGRTPFVITQLVCAAIDSALLDRVAELVSQPNSPNLYWALTQLPRPLVDMRPAIELQQRFLQMTVSGLDDPIQTETEWNRRALAVIHYFRESDDAARLQREGNGQAFEQVVKLARAELPAWTAGGETRVAAMSNGEAAARWLIDVNDELASEATATMSLDPPLAIPRLQALQKRVVEFCAALGVARSNFVVVSLNSYAATHRIEREIDALRVVEALRNYAAAHHSLLPDSLQQINEVPVPNDPFTGKPFHYELKEGLATIAAAGIKLSDPEREVGAIRYHIRIRN